MTKQDLFDFHAPELQPDGSFLINGEAPSLEAAEAEVERTKDAGGPRYVLALRELNGWLSGYYDVKSSL